MVFVVKQLLVCKMPNVQQWRSSQSNVPLPIQILRNSLALTGGKALMDACGIEFSILLYFSFFTQ